MTPNSIKFVFFGTPELSAEILAYLKSKGLVPSLIVTNPDRPQGRKLVLTSPPVKLWAIENNIPFLQPEELNQNSRIKIQESRPELFVVVAYGKILPKEVLAIPPKGSLNIHYSLLPNYRGASPIETAILEDDRHAGVSILLLDEKMDHGPVVARAEVIVPTWPPSGIELRALCNTVGAKLLAETIPKFVAGEIQPEEQDHSKATYAGKFEKQDGEIDLAADAYKNFLKIRAFEGTIGTYFFADTQSKKIRVVIKSASYENGILKIMQVIPEGKKEMAYEIFARSLKL